MTAATQPSIEDIVLGALPWIPKVPPPACSPAAPAAAAPLPIQLNQRPRKHVSGITILLMGVVGFGLAYLWLSGQSRSVPTASVTASSPEGNGTQDTRTREQKQADLDKFDRDTAATRTVEEITRIPLMTDPDEYYKVGVDSYYGGNYKKAIIAFTEAIRLDPTDAYYYSMRGKTYTKLGNDAQAQVDSEKADQLKAGHTGTMRVPTPSESTDETKETPAPRASLVSPQTTTQEITNFLQRHLNLEQQHDMRSSMQDYAPRVLYYDNGFVEQGFISKDKQDYFTRWPVTQEQTVSDMSVSSLISGEKWSVTFRSAFRVENPVRGDWIQGQVDCYYVVGRTDGDIKILTENGNVLKKQKGTLSGYRPSAPLGQGTSPQPEDESQITRDQRRVYTLPELRTLFGHRLNAAWLRGDFIVVQRLGSHAVLRSRAETARFGLEILQNGRPMIFPGQTFINVTLNREIDGMISDNLITFPESDPLRLTSVSKDAQGHTVVEAEF